MYNNNYGGMDTLEEDNTVIMKVKYKCACMWETARGMEERKQTETTLN